MVRRHLCYTSNQTISVMLQTSVRQNNQIQNVKAVAHDISGSFYKRPKRELRLNSLSLQSCLNRSSVLALVCLSSFDLYLQYSFLSHFL